MTCWNLVNMKALMENGHESCPDMEYILFHLKMSYGEHTSLLKSVYLVAEKRLGFSITLWIRNN